MIGIFDSGVGGLTVVKHIMQTKPGESIVYFGDTARAPYGVLSNEQITAQSKQIMRFLVGFKPETVIIACNTICAACYDDLAGAFDVPVVEIITPTAQSCVSLPNVKKIGVIATDFTVRNNVYYDKIKQLNGDLEVYQQACPDLTTIAERGLADSDEGRTAIRGYLKDLKDKGIDSLILGCTHYPLFTKHIVEYLGKKVRLVSSAEININKTGQGVKPQILDFYISGDPRLFKITANNLLGVEIEPIQIDIEKY